MLKKKIRKQKDAKKDKKIRFFLKTRARAQKKVDQMRSHVAYAREILDSSQLNQFYEVR